MRTLKFPDGTSVIVNNDEDVLREVARRYCAIINDHTTVVEWDNNKVVAQLIEEPEPTKPAPIDLITKFPQLLLSDEENGDSPREDMICPECGARDTLEVLGTIMAWGHLTDDGVDHDGGDFEYDQDSECRCSDCDHEATLGDFTCQGLDDFIAERRGAEEEENDEEYYIVSPDGIAFLETSSNSAEAAWDGFDQEILPKFTRQGYYKTATGERIPVAELKGRCTCVIAEGDDTKEEEAPHGH